MKANDGGLSYEERKRPSWACSFASAALTSVLTATRIATLRLTTGATLGNPLFRGE
jgi:hypothetical protein